MWWLYLRFFFAPIRPVPWHIWIGLFLRVAIGLFCIFVNVQLLGHVNVPTSGLQLAALIVLPAALLLTIAILVYAYRYGDPNSSSSGREEA